MVSFSLMPASRPYVLLRISPAGCWVTPFYPQNSPHNHNIFVIMVQIVLVGFLPCDNGRSLTCIHLGVATCWYWTEKTTRLACCSVCGWWCQTSCHVTPSTAKAQMDVVSVLLCMNTQPRGMDVGWMDAPYASLMCLYAMMLTTRCIVFITTIVVMGTHELSIIKIDDN